MQRLVVLAFGLSLSLALPATGDEAAGPGYVASPLWQTAPPEAALPANFAEADYRQFVPLVCRVRGDILTVCHPVDTLPSETFLQAAMYAAGVARIGPYDGLGRSTEGRDVCLFINFPLKPGDAPTPPNTPPRAYERLSGVNWVERPSANLFDRNYPAEAWRNRVAGHATLDCLVNAAGRIVCTVLSEAPGGAGFGDAAIGIARAFRSADHTSDGHPTAGGRVRINLTFNPPP